MSRGAGGGSPRRRSSGAALVRELLVFVEGRLTEETYLVDWHRRHRDRIHVTIDPYRGGPLQLVEHAIEVQRAEAHDAKRQRGRAHDQIWCVFDRDEHPNFASALDLAYQHGIGVAVSNPCIELWFLLHFEDCRTHVDRHEVQHQVEAILHCGKRLSSAAVAMLAERYDQAKRRAILLDRKHEGDGSPPGTNPSSGLWKVVDEIRNA